MTKLPIELCHFPGLFSGLKNTENSV